MGSTMVSDSRIQFSKDGAILTAVRQDGIITLSIRDRELFSTLSLSNETFADMPMSDWGTHGANFLDILWPVWSITNVVEGESLPATINLGHRDSEYLVRWLRDSSETLPDKSVSYQLPRQIHFILTSGEISYLYYLGIASAKKNIDAEINLWCFEEPCGEYWPYIADKINVHIVPKPLYPGIDTLEGHDWATAISDYLRWKILYEYGGIYLDLDTISLADPFHLHDPKYEMTIGLEVEEIDGDMLPFNSAIVMAFPGSIIMKQILDRAVEILGGDTIKHGQIGPHLISEQVKANRQQINILPFGTFGGWGRAGLVNKLFMQEGELWENATILHLYAKNFRPYVEVISEAFVRTNNWLLTRLIRQALMPEEYSPSPAIIYDKHCKPLFDYLVSHKCCNILEVGTYNGDNAIRMIQASQSPNVTYYGFDLFHSMSSELAEKEGMTWGGSSYFMDAPSVDVVSERIKQATGAKVKLYAGDTTKLDIGALDLPEMDIIYVDGGHSIATIANDWNKFSTLMGANTMVFMDDYVDNELNMGSKLLVDKLSANIDEYEVTVYPEMDIYSSNRKTHLASIRFKNEMNVHFLTTGKGFPYVYYLSVMTALHVYGDRVILWATQEPNSKYFQALKDKVTIRYVENIQAFPVLDTLNEHERNVAVFDNVIWKIMAEYGGMLMGLDCITLKPHFDLLEFGKEALIGIDHEGRQDSLAMEGMIVQPGSEIAKLVAADSDAALKRNDYKFGEAGAGPASWRCKEFPDKVTFAPFGIISGFWHNGTGHYIFAEDGELITPDTRMISLYGTSTKAIVDSIDPAYVVNSQSLYARLIRQMLTKVEYDPYGEANKSVIIPGAINNRKKRFHLLGLAHLPTNKERAGACAFSQKVLKMGTMLKSLGHEVIFYGVEGSTVECDEFVQVSSQRILDETYGQYDHTKEQYKHDPKDFAHQWFNARCITEVCRRKKNNDFLLVSMGNYQKSIVDGVQPLRFAIESGIGYSGVFAEFKVFETYAWMHHVYGLMNQTLGSYYDAVIPNYFDPADFTYSDQKGDYFLFIGRLIQNKGLIIAKRTVESIGAKLLVAGQPTNENVDLSGPNVEYIGFADWERRRELMKNAKALFVPTVYIEPFGGVSIEAAFSGTPVITTDWGCFAENVIHGKTGYRCRTLDQFVWAANNIDKIKPEDCYEWAMNNFTLDRVKLMYEEYFNMVLDIDGYGWDTIHKDRNEMDWLSRIYPD